CEASRLVHRKSCRFRHLTWVPISKVHSEQIVQHRLEAATVELGIQGPEPCAVLPSAVRHLEYGEAPLGLSYGYHPTLIRRDENMKAVLYVDRVNALLLDKQGR